MTDTHRFLAVLGLGAVALHGAALVLDQTVRVSPLALLVPGLVSYRPVVDGGRRPRGRADGPRLRLVRAPAPDRRQELAPAALATFGLFGLATVHGLAAGSDSGAPWAFALYAGAIGAVVIATAWRALASPLPARERRTA